MGQHLHKVKVLFFSTWMEMEVQGQRQVKIVWAAQSHLFFWLHFPPEGLKKPQKQNKKQKNKRSKWGLGFWINDKY